MAHCLKSSLLKHERILSKTSYASTFRSTFRPRAGKTTIVRENKDKVNLSRSEAGSDSDELEASSVYKPDPELEETATQDNFSKAWPDAADPLVPTTRKRTASEAFLPSTESPERTTIRAKRNKPAFWLESENYHWKIPFVSINAGGIFCGSGKEFDLCRLCPASTASRC